MDKKYIVKKIDKPEKIDLFKHIVLFINEDGEIELVYPDFEEKYLDTVSSNVVKVEDKDDIDYFEILMPNEVNDDVPIYRIGMYNKISNDYLRCNQYLVNDSECINKFNTSLSDEVRRNKTKLKKLTK